MGNLFYKRLSEAILREGGAHNAHLHLDRAYTLDDGYVDAGRVSVLRASHLSLQTKHALIATVHEGRAYDDDDLERRMQEATDELIAADTRLADTMIDVTADRVGTDALHLAMEHAAAVAHKIHIRAAAYSPLGFRDDCPEQWRVFEDGVGMADFVGSLPEVDDRDDHPEHIGYEEHLERMLDLVIRHKKMLHVHTDQRNEPSEHGTERLIEAMRRTPPHLEPGDEPLVWAVHMISPSTYDNKRWEAFVEGLLECNIGVICCPSAAIGMRQLRSNMTPTCNSIPRVLELAAAGVPIRLGSDNVADMCSPSTTANIVDEVFVLSAAVRFYDPEILGKFAAGTALSEADRAKIAVHLRENDVEIQKLVQSPVPLRGQRSSARASA